MGFSEDTHSAGARQFVLGDPLSRALVVRWGHLPRRHPNRRHPDNPPPHDSFVTQSRDLNCFRIFMSVG